MTKERDMLESVRDLETTIELVERAQIKKRPSEFNRLLSSLDTIWYKFNSNYQIYKSETIKKSAKTLAVFNSTKLENAIEVPVYEYNDLWRKVYFHRYGEVRDALQDIIDELEESQPKNLSVNNDLEQAALDIKTEIDATDSAISKLESEIKGVPDGEMSTTMVVEYKENIARLTVSISQDLKNLVHVKLSLPGESSKPEFSNESIRQLYSGQSLTWKQKLNDLYLSLAKKSEAKVVQEAKPTFSVSETSDGASPTFAPMQREQVFLEKTKPPRFDGSELEFPEFQHKWKAQVNKAGLPVESELDKLRDAVPKQAKDMLFGVTCLDEAWKILSHRFGNKDLISKKLKEQLKSVTCEGKNDLERLMDLKIKVGNIVTRLKTMSLESALQHDPD